VSNQIVPTKGNLLATKKSLELSLTGFELLDRKRNILVREMMALIDRASSIQGKIDKTYEEAYALLQRANITLGICSQMAQTVPIEDGLNVAYRSVMGVEIPHGVS
jgi:V/A-type H+/Na+-transporting ATPase subunit D